jgi:GTPase SAR1 family protein
MKDVVMLFVECVILIFDLTSSKSFAIAVTYYEYVRGYLGKNVHIILVGNNVDKVKERQVKYEDIVILQVEKDMTYFEISTTRGTNVENVYISMMEKVTKEKYLESIE